VLFFVCCKVQGEMEEMLTSGRILVVPEEYEERVG
jgi:hypothetical protein